MHLTLEAAQEKLNLSGIADAEHIASGMEGHVFRIGDQNVAKVWFDKSVDEIFSLQHFYEQLQSLSLPFETPYITQVRGADGVTISVERELSGTPMRNLVAEDESEPLPFALEATLKVLRALKETDLSGAESDLAILGVIPSQRAKHSGVTSVLLEVAEQKVSRYGTQLRKSVPDFDWIYQRTIYHLLKMEPNKPQAVHGDLCPENFLLDEHNNVSAVLDWGFLSLLGDSALDASIACGVYNMYGPYHRQLDDIFLSACKETLDYSRERLLVYRALYAILTSSTYSEDVDDGHYIWCTENLLRDDIRNALAREHIR